MSWIPALTFAIVSLLVSAGVSVLTVNLEPQPEYPAIMTDTMRFIGWLIAIGAGLFGSFMLLYAVLLYFA